MYPSKISMKCKKLREEVNKYNITSHPAAKEMKQEVFSLTKHFPEKISFSFRIRAVAEQKECKCKACGTIHGHPDKAYCSHKCYTSVKVHTAISAKAHAHNVRVLRSEKKFAGKKEGIDYLVCAICGVKSGDLGVHVRMHGITPLEYKQQHRLRYLKPESNRLNRQGENNPAYGHGGKYSAWSKNFVHGYDEQRHYEKNLQQSEFVKANLHLFKSTIEYWLNETNGNIEEATTLLKKSQTRDLEYFITKYGEEDGRKRYELKTARWLKSFKTSNFSAISQELFEVVADRLTEREDIYYATYDREDQKHRKNKEYVLPVGQGRFIRPDFICVNLKKIIEFDGDYWHSPAVANPAREQQRDQHIADSGYQVFHVKECDYKNNKEKVIQECLNFLTQQNENSQT